MDSSSGKVALNTLLISTLVAAIKWQSDSLSLEPNPSDLDDPGKEIIERSLLGDSKEMIAEMHREHEKQKAAYLPKSDIFAN
jgi:hypothetical protein